MSGRTPMLKRTRPNANVATVSTLNLFDIIPASDGEPEERFYDARGGFPKRLKVDLNQYSPRRAYRERLGVPPVWGKGSQYKVNPYTRSGAPIYFDDGNMVVDNLALLASAALRVVELPGKILLEVAQALLSLSELPRGFLGPPRPRPRQLTYRNPNSGLFSIR
jgi:hypothetical protein